MDFGCFLLGGLGSAHFSHFLVTEFVDGVLPCLFLFFLGEFYRMVYHHFAVDWVAYLNLAFLPIVDFNYEDFIIFKAVETAFLNFVDYVSNSVLH